MIYSMDVFVMIKLQFQPQRIKKGSTLRVLELKKLFLKSESLLHIGCFNYPSIRKNSEDTCLKYMKFNSSTIYYVSSIPHLNFFQPRLVFHSF